MDPKFESLIIFLSGYFCGIIVENFSNKLKNKQNEAYRIRHNRFNDGCDFVLNLDLNKADFIRLITSYSPPPSAISKFVNENLGQFYNSSPSPWRWNVPFLFGLSKESLIKLYDYLKNNVSEFSKYNYKKE